jgi:hypothetical protein
VRTRPRDNNMRLCKKLVEALDSVLCAHRVDNIEMQWSDICSGLAEDLLFLVHVRTHNVYDEAASLEI